MPKYSHDVINAARQPRDSSFQTPEILVKFQWLTPSEAATSIYGIGKILDCNRISETAEARVAKFCFKVEYINC